MPARAKGTARAKAAARARATAQARAAALASTSGEGRAPGEGRTSREGSASGEGRTPGAAKAAAGAAPAKGPKPLRVAAPAKGPKRLRVAAAVNGPKALRVAAAAQALEALGAVVAGVFAAVSTAQGHSSTRANGLALTVLVFIIAALLAAFAVGLARARPWSRVPAIMTQLVVIVAGVVLLDGHRPEWGVPALVLAIACLAGMLTPASLRALNRSPDELPFRD